MARTVVMPPESTVTMPMHSQIMRVLLQQERAVRKVPARRSRATSHAHVLG